MDIIRLRFQTPVAEWRKVRRDSDNSIRHFRNPGYVPKKQTSFAAAATHLIEDFEEIGEYQGQYYEIDNTGRFVTYDDAIEVGYTFVPSIDFLELQEDFAGINPGIGELGNIFAEIFKTDLHLRRNTLEVSGEIPIQYEGVFWGIHYTVIDSDGMGHNSVRNTDMFSWPESDIDIIENQFMGIWGDIIAAYDSYHNVLVHNIFVKYRNNDLEL